MSVVRLSLILGLALAALAPAPAQACKCIPATVSSAYHSSSDVLRARVVYGVTLGQDQWYLARAEATYKGCIKPGSWVYVRTASSSAACGVTLQTGIRYLISGSLDTSGNYTAPVISISSCGFTRPISQLSKNDRRFLLSRYNCCGDSCACTNGKPPVNCFVDPCQVAGCPSGECESNYCGGCNAEFYDANGYETCNACNSNADCAYGQSCTGGMCLGVCHSDADCGKDHWCRPTEESSMFASPLLIGTCTAYQGEGEYCGGFTPIWASTQCAPGLVCTDTPPFIADAPGICRQPCKSNDGCPENQYCGSNNVCRDDGACFEHADCSASGNSYITVKCLGYALCGDGGQCKYQCGNIKCADLTGVNFGFCDMVMGYGLVNGKCQAISGCGSSVFSLWPSMEECVAGCNLK